MPAQNDSFADLIAAFWGESDHPFLEPDLVTFLEKFVLDPDRGELLELVDETRYVLREMSRRDDDGYFLYSTWLYSMPKKSAKTLFTAAAGLWQAWQVDNGQVYIIGNDKEQADSRLFRVIEYTCKHHPEMKKHAVCVRYKITLSNGTVIKAIPLDPGGEAGMNPTAIIWTEAWAAVGKKAEQMWTEAVLSPSRAGLSFKLVESYAGYTGESKVLERLYQSIVDEQYLIDRDYELYADERTGTIGYWCTRRIMPWQHGEQAEKYYAGERAQKTPAEFSRQHDNKWITSENKFVPDEWWEACKIEALPAGWEKRWMVMALDAAVSNDSFAVVVVFRIDDKTYIPICRVWEPPKNGEIDFDDVENHIMQMVKQYRITTIVYDPYQLHDMATRIKKRGVRIEKFDQGQPRLLADKAFYDRVRDGRIAHIGDPTLTQHIKNSNAKTEGDKMRIVKREEKLKIDAGVAASMAVEKAHQLYIG